jgi:hypothetical protein
MKKRIDELSISFIFLKNKMWLLNFWKEIS